MRRAAALITAILILICMTVSVSAETGATSMSIHSTVNADGSCQVNVHMTLHLDTPQEDLSFPIPAGAYEIRVNGVSPSSHRRGETLVLDLGRILGAVAGDFSVSISYSLPKVVDYAEDGETLMLTLPLLCGFAHPIDSLGFSLTLPGDLPVRPALSSTYYQTRIEESLDLTVDGAQATGILSSRILGSDWLTLTLRVSEEMFPQEKPIVWSMDLPDVAMIVCAILALAYWLLTLRCLPPRAIRRSNAPDGVTAGDMAPALTMGRTDLTMLVVHWAQMGYILIQLDDNGRVLLHKRMNMGNERSQYENRVFRSLFGSRKLIDGTGFHYAQLCRKVSAGKPGIHGLFRPQSGNPGIFRLLAALIGLFGGVSLGSALGDGSIFRGLLMVVYAMFGAVSAWVIQEGGKCLHLRNKGSLWLALGLSALWLVLGIWANELNVAAWVVAAELLAGLAAAYGGRRTELGKQAFQQILGLRRYLKTVSKEELQRILKTNPDYYYSLAPYALALGVDAAFAKRFGGIRMPACPYLTTGMDGHLTALEWSKHLRDAVHALDERQKHLLWERLLGK